MNAVYRILGQQHSMDPLRQDQFQDPRAFACKFSTFSKVDGSLEILSENPCLWQEGFVWLERLRHNGCDERRAIACEPLDWRVEFCCE